MEAERIAERRSCADPTARPFPRRNLSNHGHSDTNSATCGPQGVATQVSELEITRLRALLKTGSLAGSHHRVSQVRCRVAGMRTMPVQSGHIFAKVDNGETKSAKHARPSGRRNQICVNASSAQLARSIAAVQRAHPVLPSINRHARQHTLPRALSMPPLCADGLLP